MRISDWSSDVCSSDLLMVGEPGCLKQMVEAYHDLGGNLICTEEVAADQTHKYGILTPGAQAGPITEVKGLVEKPAADVAPSRLAIIGRYILQPEVMDVLGSQEEGAGGEIQLTDALRSEEHTSELQSLMRITYAVCCW